jgi:AcrR family transcriptional regulator
VTAEGALTPERILVAAEGVLRRHGLAKANVVDVSRALGVSHGSVYRHFPSKTALREAVTRRWLDNAHPGLAEIATEDGPAPERIRRWLHALFAAKRRKAGEDPELFATYSALLADSSGVVQAHVIDLLGQLTAILTSGGLAAEHALTIFEATIVYHHPAHAARWADPDAEARLDRIITLLLAGISSRAGT